MSSAPISVADLLVAASRLQAGPETKARIAVQLGLAGPPSRSGPPGVRSQLVGTSAAASGPSVRSTPEPGGSLDVHLPSPVDPRPLRRPVITITRPPVRLPPRPIEEDVEGVLTGTPGPALAAPGARADQPLFPPAQQRAILTALVAVSRPGRELDLPAAVTRAATRRPLAPVPRRLERTTRAGVLLLIDNAPSMRPFAWDTRMLTATLRTVIGSDAVEPVTIVAGDEGFNPVRRLRRESLISVPGRPILVVTDLGIARSPNPQPDAAEHWLALAAAADAANSPLVFLVPYPPARWPGWAVRHRLRVVQWDRATNATRARRAVGKARA